MARFANAYWSPDYRSGIELLSKQLLTSLNQLHELRRFIFNYMNYHHSNSGYMAKLAKESLPMDSSFREEREEKHILSGSKKSSQEQKPREVDVKYVFKEFVDRTALELQLQLNVASEIESEVLGKITGFIKLHEPQIKSTLDRFEDLLDDYDESRRKMERTKGKYDEMVRLGELEGHDHRIEHDPDESVSSVPGTPERPKHAYDLEDEALEDGQSQLNLSFPLLLGGGLKFESPDKLQSFLARAIASISTIKRKIPFPGYRNEIFSSDQLCDYLKSHRPHGFNPTRSNLEKLGQSLIDRKLIVGFGLFSQKFKSEGMWFEWSQEAVEFTELKSHRTSSISSVALPSSISRLSIEESSRKVNEVAGSTSKRFNTMFKNVKSSLLKPKYSEEAIHELELEYNEAYEEVQKVKQLLDMEIFQKSQIFERFEMVRIEVTYQSLTKLLEVLYRNSASAVSSLHNFTSNFIEKLNKPHNYEKDLHDLLQSNSTGIYFPAIVLPHHGLKEHFDPSLLNTSFQNIKFTFNLYKDIPLQVKNSDVDNESLMSTRSLPLLLKSLVEATFLADKSELKELWIAPIDHQEYWLLKQEVIQLIQEFDPPDDLNVQDEKAVEIAIVKKVAERLSAASANSLLNFLKNWLLETSDSVIPCTIYDSLLNLHKDSKGDTANESIKVLSSIPRSNLCSLIFILESVSFIFGLQSIDEYGLTDDVAIQDHEEIDVAPFVEQLNSMDSIGSVPFLHLILRPSVVKNSSGFKPPKEAYNALLLTLLDINVREKLCIALITHEKNFLERTKRQEQNLGINKGARIASKDNSATRNDTPKVEIQAETPTKPTKHVSSPTPKSPNPVSGDQFSLRPFRTGVTPRPSPVSSPVHTKRFTNERSRNRSDSGHLISIDKGDDEEND